MEIQVAAVTDESAPADVAMSIGDGNGNGEFTEQPVNSCTLTSPSNVSSISSSTPSKKAVDRELRQPFPVKVYEMLENADKKQFSHAVSWNPQGTGFMVHDKNSFTKLIVPDYFNLTKYKSFQRQVSPKRIVLLSFSIFAFVYSRFVRDTFLHAQTLQLSLYGFQRVTVGPNKGLRYHEKLRRGELELVRQMKPIGYKPRNVTRLLEQRKQKHKQQQQMGRATNILTTTTTTVVKTTTTSTTLVSNDSSKNSTNAIPTDGNASTNTAVPHDVAFTTAMGNIPMSDAYVSSLPPVVSTNSLTKQEDHGGRTIESMKQQLEPKTNEVHSISPETTCHNQIHFPGGGGYDVAAGHRAGPQAELEVVNFEGMCFHLMSPTRDLGINVKLKLLEEFNPASSLLRLASKYKYASTTEHTPKCKTDHTAAATIPEELPITIDTVQNDRPSLLEPFTNIVSTAAATSTASTIAALQAAAENSAALNNEQSIFGTTTTPPLLAASEPRCMDALDYHSTNVANRIKV